MATDDVRHGDGLEVEGLTVSFDGPKGRRAVVRDVDMKIAPGETLGVIGESGSGKSVTALAIMGLINAPGRIESGSVRLGGQELVGVREKDLQQVRGRRVAMVFQDPGTTLNPVLTIGRQMAEMVRREGNLSRAEIDERCVSLLDRVGISEPRRRLNQYPHEISGGMQQRVIVAIAIALNPPLVIADEPTTALDVTVQAEILNLLKELQRENGMGLMLISHDVSVVRQLCSTVAVMYAGRMVEVGPTEEALAAPAHPYLAGLLGSVPNLNLTQTSLPAIPGSIPDPGSTPPGCAYHPRCSLAFDKCREAEPLLVAAGANRSAACHLHESGADGSALNLLDTVWQGVALREASPVAEDVDLRADQSSAQHDQVLLVKDLVKDFDVGRLFRPQTTRVVRGVSFEVHRGQALGIVGESGSGKSTIAKMVMSLETPTSGLIELVGLNVEDESVRKDKTWRRKAQMVFQNPYSSLDPRMTVETIVGEPLAIHGELDPHNSREQVLELLAAVSMGESYLRRMPSQLSGGQRQRVAIARALALQPDLLVADEPVSALDVTVQAQIINLFAELKATRGLGLLFISHDLAVVDHLCDDTAVMYSGEFVETGPVSEIMRSPRHPYTQLLIDSIPRADRAEESLGKQASVDTSPATGLEHCRFAPRCPHAQPQCFTERPPIVEVSQGHSVMCHLVASGDL